MYEVLKRFSVTSIVSNRIQISTSKDHKYDFQPANQPKKSLKTKSFGGFMLFKHVTKSHPTKTKKTSSQATCSSLSSFSFWPSSNIPRHVTCHITFRSRPSNAMCCIRGCWSATDCQAAFHLCALWWFGNAVITSWYGCFLKRWYPKMDGL